ncbi:MAG TPA: OmpA family protein [Byssovorax sp.]|jgi:OOP family OmpA-OmpF porin
MHTSKNFLRVAALSLMVTATFACGDPPPPPVAPPPPPPPAPVQEVVVVAPEPIKLPAPVKFATGSAALSPESDAVLQVVAEYMQRSADTTLLRIEGHTDNVGGTDANQKLSEGRALSVANWLVAHGVECRRLLPVGFGETRPVATNDNEAGRAQNRRTVFIAAEIKGRKIDVDPAKGGHIAADVCGGRAVLAGPNPFQPGQTWVGAYKCRQGQTALRLKVENVSGASVAAVFDFGKLPGTNGTVPHGAFRVNGVYDVATHKIEFKPGEWIEHPPTFSTVGMIGEVTGDGGQYFGSIASPGCSEFSINLKK